MKKLWEYFENLEEQVYAADIDTYDLIYLNRRGREVYGIQSLDQLAGKKCYELLQGCAAPCAICNNSRLQRDHFLEWRYYNPVQGATYALKDTLVEEDGRRIRVELALAIPNLGSGQDRKVQGYLSREAMLNEALRLSLQAADPDDAISILLEYMGRSLHCERIYIFEERPGLLYDNTYEWCASGVTPQKDNLQGLTVRDIRPWLDRFTKRQNVIITDMEKVKNTDPVIYDYLAPQDIRSLVAGPLVFHGKVVGFYGVDNPPEEMMENIDTLFQIMGHFLVSLLRRRDLVKRLEGLSYRDQMTGCGNRHGMEAHVADLDKDKSLAIIYCDVTGLKRVNDVQGHQAGDVVLCRCSDCLLACFPQDGVFRVGGDEFLVFCSGNTQEEIQEKVDHLKKTLAENELLMAVGWVWREEFPPSIDQFLTQADDKMYEEKKRYYTENPGVDRRKR